MSKLIHFKYDVFGTPGYDVQGFGKQSVLAKPRSQIALKNYNIQLTPDQFSSKFVIAESDIFSFGQLGLLENTHLSAGEYNLDELREALWMRCNMIPGQNDGATKGLITQVDITADKKFKWTTQAFGAHEWDMADEDILAVQIQQGGLVVLNDGLYDASATSKSRAVFGNGLAGGAGEYLMLGADCFACTVQQVGESCSYYLGAVIEYDEDGYEVFQSRWGFGWDADNDLFWWDNGRRVPITDVSIVDNDQIIWSRSGLTMTLVLITGGGQETSTFILPLSTFDIMELSQIEARYTLETRGDVLLHTITFPLMGVTEDCQIELQVNNLSIGKLLGFSDVLAHNSLVEDPAVYYAENGFYGGTTYRGIMVCINGLDLDTYDFSPGAEGKVNYLTTIQKETTYSTTADGGYVLAINSVAGTIATETWIEMNNDSIVNVNNKLSIFLIERASGRKLAFDYADFLLLIRSG